MRVIAYAVDDSVLAKITLINITFDIPILKLAMW